MQQLGGVVGLELDTRSVLVVGDAIAIAANAEVTVEMAEFVSEIFTEVIIAPAYEPGAVEILARKKNIRVLVASEPPVDGAELRQISGGLLIQERDTLNAPGDDPANWTLATGTPADAATLSDLQFAWRTCRAVKSNAIVVAADGATVGVDRERDLARGFTVTETGITVVGKGLYIERRASSVRRRRPRPEGSTS